MSCGKVLTGNHQNLYSLTYFTHTEMSYSLKETMYAWQQCVHSYLVGKSFNTASLNTLKMLL